MTNEQKAYILKLAQADLAEVQSERESVYSPRIRELLDEHLVLIRSVISAMEPSTGYWER